MTSAETPMTTATPIAPCLGEHQPGAAARDHEQGDIDEMRGEEARQAGEEGAVALARQEGVAGGAERQRGEQQQRAVLDDDAARPAAPTASVFTARALPGVGRVLTMMP